MRSRVNARAPRTFSQMAITQTTAPVMNVGPRPASSSAVVWPTARITKREDHGAAELLGLLGVVHPDRHPHHDPEPDGGDRRRDPQDHHGPQHRGHEQALHAGHAEALATTQNRANPIHETATDGTKPTSSLPM